VRAEARFQVSAGIVESRHVGFFSYSRATSALTAVALEYFNSLYWRYVYPGYLPAFDRF